MKYSVLDICIIMSRHRNQPSYIGSIVGLHMLRSTLKVKTWSILISSVHLRLGVYLQGAWGNQIKSSHLANTAKNKYEMVNMIVSDLFTFYSCAKGLSGEYRRLTPDDKWWTCVRWLLSDGAFECWGYNISSSAILVLQCMVAPYRNRGTCWEILGII